MTCSPPDCDNNPYYGKSPEVAGSQDRASAKTSIGESGSAQYRARKTGARIHDNAPTSWRDYLPYESVGRGGKRLAVVLDRGGVDAAGGGGRGGQKRGVACIVGASPLNFFCPIDAQHSYMVGVMGDVVEFDRDRMRRSEVGSVGPVLSALMDLVMDIEDGVVSPDVVYVAMVSDGGPERYPFVSAGGSSLEVCGLLAKHLQMAGGKL